MKATIRIITPFAVGMLVGTGTRLAPGQPAGAAQAVAANPETVEVTRTNWVGRVITNVTEIHLPTNVFVTQYRTNWIERMITNVVEVYKTKWLTKTLTNFVPIELVKTNQLVVYQTNWKTLTLTNMDLVVSVRTNWVRQTVTNIVDVYVTNWVAWTVTRTVPVELVRSNVVLVYQTNWKTLTLTNLETVVIVQTNWVRKKVTNIVALDMELQLPSEKKVAGAGADSAQAAPALASGEWADVYVLEANKTGKQLTNNQVEVQLKVRSATDPSAGIEVQNWRLERTDGAIVLSGQDAEFKRALPPGTYNVQVKLRHDSSSPLRTLRGTVTVTAGVDDSQKLSVLLR